MAIIPSIVEDNIFTALRTFLVSVVDCEVIRTQTNRVSIPKGPFVAMTAITSVPLSTNIHAYTDTEKTILRPEQFSAQIDCYGQGAGDRARAISTLLRDPFACDSFAASGFDIQPLYADDARQMPLIDGEAQYEERWTFDCQLQINPVLTIPQDSATTLTTGVVNIDTAFPA